MAQPLNQDVPQPATMADEPINQDLLKNGGYDDDNYADDDDDDGDDDNDNDARPSFPPHTLTEHKDSDSDYNSYSDRFCDTLSVYSDDRTASSCLCPSCTGIGGRADFYDSESEEGEEAFGFTISFLTSHRYLRGRAPSNLNENPKGKHHRKPLAWRRNKMASAGAWDSDKDLLDKHIWEQQKQQQQKKNGGDDSSPKKIPTLAVRKPKRKKNNNKKQKVNNRNSIVDMNRERKQVKKLVSPHFLLQVKADAARRRTTSERPTACSCCMAWAVRNSTHWWSRYEKKFFPADCREGIELFADGVMAPGDPIDFIKGPKVWEDWRLGHWSTYMEWDDWYEYDSGREREEMEMREIEEYERALLEEDKLYGEGEGNTTDEMNEEEEEEEEKEEGKDGQDVAGDIENEEDVVQGEIETGEQKENEQEASCATEDKSEVNNEPEAGEEKEEEEASKPEAPPAPAAGEVGDTSPKPQDPDPAREDEKKDSEEQQKRDPDLGPEWAVIARAANGEKVFEIGYSPSDTDSNRSDAGWSVISCSHQMGKW